MHEESVNERVFAHVQRLERERREGRLAKRSRRLTLVTTLMVGIGLVLLVLPGV